ncbi:MAG TPA: amidohydrolase family protein [Gemmatimonadales bacterium]|nr:amidohydrolase family protein [Gemmatimonadales bacterium]
MLAASVVGLAGCGAGAERPRVAFVGGTLWDGSGGPPISDAVVIVANGRIEAAGAADAVRIPRGAEQVLVTGRWIIPGLIDAHTQAARWTLSRHVAYGVTTVRSLGGSHDSAFALRDDVGLGSLAGPRLLVSGAWIDRAPTRLLAATTIATPEEARRAIDDRILRDASVAAIGPRVDQRLMSAMLDEARTVSLPVAGLLGRLDALTAARLGVSSIEQLSGIAESAVADPAALFRAHDEPGAAWKAVGHAWSGLDSARLHRVAVGLKDAGVALVPALVLHEARARLTDPAYAASLDASGIPEGARAAWDGAAAARNAGLSPGDLAALRRARTAQDRLVRLFKAAGGMVAAGSGSPGPLVAPGASLHDELVLLVRAGLTPREALLAATRDAARVAGVDSVGGVRAGMVADFLVLAASPLDDIANTRRIERIVVRGLARSPAELRTLWE